MALPLLLRPATKLDAPVIARNVMAAWGTDPSAAAPEDATGQLLQAMTQICGRDDTLYSYRHTTIAEAADGTAVGSLTAYDGALYEPLRDVTFALLSALMGQPAPTHNDIETHAGEYYCDSLAVSPSHRGQGVATALLRHAEQQAAAAAAEVNTMALAVAPDNAAAQRLYERLGYHNDGSSICLFGHTFSRMAKPITAAAALCVERDGDFDAACPHFVGAVITAEVTNSPTSPALWADIVAAGATLRRDYTTETIKSHPGIAATRAAYKAAGKDPSRYRPSCEQLCRRLLQGKDLYSVDTIVDLGNLVSIAYGYSTGLLDADKIQGAKVVLGIGREGEAYEGIGRGALNIACLPVYRDAQGTRAIATPTSDSTHTMLSAATRHLCCFINGYDGDRSRVEAAVRYTCRLLCQYAESRLCTVAYY